MKPKQITSAVNQALAAGFQINTSNDTQYLDGQNYSWDDLNQLKQELGNTVIEFVTQVAQVTTNQQIMSNLGAKKAHFDRTVEVFFSDINVFSNKVAELRVQHEQMTGPVTDINQFNLYNRLAITYTTLFNELQVLVTPTLSDIMLTVSELTIPVAPAAVEAAPVVQ